MQVLLAHVPMISPTRDLHGGRTGPQEAGTADVRELAAKHLLGRLGHGAEVEVSLFLRHALRLLLKLPAVRVNHAVAYVVPLRQCDGPVGVLHVVVMRPPHAQLTEREEVIEGLESRFVEDLADG